MDEFSFNDLFLDYRDWLGDFKTSTPEEWKEYLIKDVYPRVLGDNSSISNRTISGKFMLDMISRIEGIQTMLEEDEGDSLPSEIIEAYEHMYDVLVPYSNDFLQQNFSVYDARSYGLILYLYGKTRFFDLCHMLCKYDNFRALQLDDIGNFA